MMRLPGEATGVEAPTQHPWHLDRSTSNCNILLDHTCPWADAPNHDKVDFTATAVSLSADLPVSNNLAVLKNHLSLGVDLGNYDQEKAVQHVASGTPADTASSLPTACILS